MSIYKIFTISDNSVVGIWKIEETYDELFNLVKSYGFDEIGRASCRERV